MYITVSCWTKNHNSSIYLKSRSSRGRRWPQQIRWNIYRYQDDTYWSYYFRVDKCLPDLQWCWQSYSSPSHNLGSVGGLGITERGNWLRLAVDIRDDGTGLLLWSFLDSFVGILTWTKRCILLWFSLQSPLFQYKQVLTISDPSHTHLSDTLLSQLPHDKEIVLS